MKDAMSIWSRLSGRHYAVVSQNGKSDEQQWEQNLRESQDPSLYARSLRRKSSVVVNNFFSNAIPVHPDGRPKWSGSIFMLMTMGLLGLFTGCLLLALQPYDYIFKYKSIFGKGGEMFDIWRVPPIDLYLKVYLFNVTNHEAYMSGQDAKIKLQQVGPYVYKEFLEHGNISFNDNGTVSTVPLHPLKFMPHLSNGTESDVIIMPNIALLVLQSIKRDSVEQVSGNQKKNSKNSKVRL
ncbi:lysosome membrane protein 2-like [Copidosoma floridanum]|uniref:lysosome membrane protein 2-like n=1 Tax=Copidosoma floridanum TaxID=29053 RepID=UPI0006C9BB4B|nr:lysosome membrane protein 2-like [Copidosoma floridanum]